MWWRDHVLKSDQVTQPTGGGLFSRLANQRNRIFISFPSLGQPSFLPMEDEQYMVPCPRRSLFAQGGQRPIHSVYHPPLPLTTAVNRQVQLCQ